MLSKALDRLGISASLICLVHCLSLPVIAIIAPQFLHLGHDHSWFHLAILIPVFLAATLGLWSGYRAHRHRLPLYLGFSGLGILILAAFLYREEIVGTWGDVGITLVGSVLLIRAHLFNLRHCNVQH